AALYTQIPPERLEQAKRAAAALGDNVYTKFPFAGTTQPMSDDVTELVLNRSWRPQLSVTGIAGLPQPGGAGNVLLPYTTAKLSLRLPPTLDAEAAGATVQKLLEESPPAAARVEFQRQSFPTAWNAPPLAPWLEQPPARATQPPSGMPPAYLPAAAAIPFMAMRGER